MKRVFILILSVQLMVYGHSSLTVVPLPFLNSSPAKPGDIVITEIMADPVPVVELPPEEYIEIYNRSENIIDLNNWKLSSADQNSYFHDVEIGPGEYLILTAAADTALFASYGRAIGLKPFPALTDKGRVIVLSDDRGNIISGVEYSSDWYGSALKSGGGWSLEIVDYDSPFFAEGNWQASSSRKGGTPGRINSSAGTNIDNDFQGLINVFPRDSMSIVILFSEPVISFEGNISGITLGESGVSAAGLSDPLYRRFIITPERYLEKGRLYTLYLPGNMTDFAGNCPSRMSFTFGLPEPPAIKDMVFNELLFNPLPDNPDYIEFYNLSGKVLDASEFFLASVGDQTGIITEPRQVTTEQRCIIPGALFTITTDRMKVISAFLFSVAENIFNVSSLPSMPDSRGHLILFNRHLDEIDEVIYSEKMHYSLLSDNEGISLEKIRPGLSSDESKNWHSASESSGWGTPGNQNSVYINGIKDEGRVILSSPKISPDNDGFEDVLVIDITTGEPGSVVTVTLFDETGSYVRRIAENYLAGNKASLVWDGTADDGTPVRSGIYIVLTELYNANGKKERWKTVVVVVR